MNVPSIKVVDLDGLAVDLMIMYKGSPMLIIIYNNSCLGCTGRAIPMAYELQQKNNELQVVGIHSNLRGEDITKEDIIGIFTAKEAPFPIYVDEDKCVYEQFGSEGTPQWILITGDGIVYRSIFGSMGGAHNRLLYAIEGLLENS